MIIPNTDNDYVLELQIPAADQLWVPDAEGIDRISVLNAHAEPVEINLAYEVRCTISPYTATALYFGEDGRWHRMVILGVVEHATGSPGRDRITGNELDNLLWGEADLAGPGGADTISGGLGSDTLMGGGGTDVLSGGDGDDVLAGGAEGDLVFGGAGNDTVLADAGADTLEGGGQAGDLLSFAGSSEGVEVRLSATGFFTLSGGDAEGDLVEGFRNLIGSAFGDLLVDPEQATLADGANANGFFGGDGRDRLYLGGGNDTGGGGDGVDHIDGGEGNDSLSGDGGNDWLAGGPGADWLKGGAGRDRFVYLRASDSSQASGVDLIADFNAAAADKIDLRKLDADAGLVGNQAFHLVLGGLTGQAGELTLQAEGGNLRVLADVNGDMQADFTLLVLNANLLNSADFLL